MGVLLGAPASLALYVLALPLVSALFLHGEMTALDARMAALALQAFAVGLPPLILVKVVAPAYFAREDTATPFRYAVAAVTANVALNLALFSWFGHVGLAFATSASAWLHAGLLLRGLTGRDVAEERRYRPTRSLKLTVARAGGAAAVMALGLGLFIPDTGQWLTAPVLTRAGWLGSAVAAGAAAYLALIWIVGERPGKLLHRV
jgi:putative peptidoglycan lipid II flippase